MWTGGQAGEGRERKRKGKKLGRKRHRMREEFRREVGWVLNGRREGFRREGIV